MSEKVLVLILCGILILVSGCVNNRTDFNFSGNAYDSIDCGEMCNNRCFGKVCDRGYSKWNDNGGCFCSCINCII